MKVKHTSIFKINQEMLWQQLMKPKSLNYISSPLLTFNYDTPPPEVWREGKYKTLLKLFGFVPLGVQNIVIEFPPAAKELLILRDNGYGKLVKKWDHWIYLQRKNEGTTIYTDEVEVKAGVLTIFIWLFAWLFYVYRQKRWKMLIKSKFENTHF